MRSPSGQDRGGMEFNMTPMIDVVFLLIIFFLVSSHLAQQEVLLELDLPEAQSSQRAISTARRVIVNVLPDGELTLSGQTVDPAELDRRIQVEGAARGGDVEVRIRCDRNVPYEFVEPVMLACARAGVWRVTFAVLQRARGT